MLNDTLSNVPEPTDLELMLYERKYITGLGVVGPLTMKQAIKEAEYERWESEQLAEYEAQEAAGGRTVCPDCGERSVLSRSVLTYGTGAPGSEYSGLYECERCDYRDLG